MQFSPKRSAIFFKKHLQKTNQLQELFQKKYVDKPVYEFEEEEGDQWYCSCRCNDVEGFGRAGSKTAAKKKAAYMVLERLLGK